MIATNAQEILDARMRGLKPADMVIISLVGPVRSGSPVVFAKAGEKYDWRWVRDLDVCVYMDDTLDWDPIVKEIGLGRPGKIDIWNFTDHWGAAVYVVPTANDVIKPVRMWKYDLDFSLWHDFQNKDFVNGTTYRRTGTGFPYAINP